MSGQNFGCVCESNFVAWNCALEVSVGPPFHTKVPTDSTNEGRKSQVGPQLDCDSGSTGSLDRPIVHWSTQTLGSHASEDKHVQFSLWAIIKIHYSWKTRSSEAQKSCMFPDRNLPGLSTESLHRGEPYIAIWWHEIWSFNAWRGLRIVVMEVQIEMTSTDLAQTPGWRIQLKNTVVPFNSNQLVDNPCTIRTKQKINILRPNNAKETKTKWEEISWAKSRFEFRVQHCSSFLDWYAMKCAWIRQGARATGDNRQFKHQTLFATQTQTQRNLIMKANQMCRICHTLISHWPKTLGYVGFEFALQLTFGA